MVSPNEKGHALERAVQAIESVILQSSPELSDRSFLMEARKRIVVDEVPHEIDLYVSVELAKGYSATYIFECKNWKAPVDKKEVVDFSEKIRATVAQRGYFIAKVFTKGAVAQAKKDSRITLLTATEHECFGAGLSSFFQVTEPSSVRADIAFYKAGSRVGERTALNLSDESKLQLHGSETLMKPFLLAWIEEIYADNLGDFDTSNFEDGVYPMPAVAERVFDVGECSFGELAIERIVIRCNFDVKVVHPPIVSDYEVATRGRAIRLGQVKVRNHSIEITVVSAPRLDS